MNKIYTHDEAAEIVEMFENVLNKYDISVPSPEDDEREDNEGLYGSTYSDLLNNVEDKLIELLKKHTSETKVIENEFSGNV
jgi:hypothetical protein